MASSSTFCRNIPLPSRPDASETPLKRKLKLFNLSLNGMAGSSIAILVFTGVLVGEVTGTSAFLSVLMASVISIFPGACFIEFTTKMPSAGSIYTFTYATIGESMAFLVGWNNMFDIIVQTSISGKAVSGLIDRWTLGSITNFTATHIGALTSAPENATDSQVQVLFDRYPDFVAALILLAVSLVLIFSVEISVTFFNVLGIIFFVCFLVVVFSCFAYGTRENLTSPNDSIFTHGFNGVINGASRIIFAFMFYDIVAVSSEEAENPQKDIPRACLISLVSTTIFLVLSTVSLSYLIPKDIMDIKSPFISGFMNLDINWMVTFIFVIFIVALITNGLSNAYSSSRYLYAISRDSLLPTFLAFLSPFKTPIVSLAIITFVGIVLAIFFDQDALVEMSQFGCVLSFLTIGVDLMILRYMPFCAPDAEMRDTLEFRPLIRRLLKDDDNKQWMKRPVFFYLLLMTEVLSIFFCAIIAAASLSFVNGIILLVSGVILGLLALVVFVILCFYEPNPLPVGQAGFTTPCLPLVPVGSIILSLILATHLSFIAWTRLLIVSSLGLVLYFVYRLWSFSQKKDDYETISDSSDHNTVISRNASRRTM